jgi:tetratricopeptide (TPR) repeat protein
LLADDARLLELIGWLGLPTITPPVATALADVPGPATLRSFDRLAEAQLVQEDADGRYSLHDLILLYTREQAAEHRSGAERAEALRRVLHWYVATARAGLRVLDPTSVHRHVVGVSTDELVQPGAELDSREQVVRWADAEHRNLLAVADLGVRAGQADLAAVVGLAAAAGRVFLFSGHTAAMAGINELLLDRAPGHPEAVAQAHTDLGVVYQETGRSALALDHLERGIAAWGRVGNRLSQAYALSGLGAALSRQGEFDRARIELNHAIEQHRSLGNADGENRALLNLGAVTFEQGRYDEAVGIFERCAELDAAGGDLSGYGISMQNLGITWQHLGDPDQAISHFDRAIDAYREAGDRPGEVSTLWECGELLHDIGDDTRARVYWTRAVSLMEELGRITADEAEAILAAPVPTKPANRH